MAEVATLARPYAGAAFDLAKSGAELDRWSRMLELLSAAAEDPRMKTLLLAPETDEAQKAFRLIEVCGDELTERARRFVHVLAANKRLLLLGQIRAQFEALRAEEQRSLDVAVTSAFALSDDQEQKLRAVLARRFEKDIQMTSDVDPSLIGGAIIQAGDMVIDGSVRGRLDKLAESVQRT